VPPLGIDAQMERQQRIRIEALENDLRRRQTSYIRRERAYKAKIEELERQLTVARRGGGSDETEGKMAAIRATHEKIIENIEKMQSTTAALMKEQEADLLRQFRVRLFDVQEELASAKAKANDENAAVWIKKYRSLEKEMEWVKALADKLEQSNKTLEKENQRLHQNFKSQEEDRAMLVKQLVLVKKDNARLQQEIQELKEKVGRWWVRATVFFGSLYFCCFGCSVRPRPARFSFLAAMSRLHALIA
jgi:chromosome segregation ATPase